MDSTSSNAAHSLAKDGHNVIITGQAGTGKSFLLSQIYLALTEKGKRVQKTASTGLAACLIADDGGATTVHALCGLKTGCFSDEELRNIASQHDVMSRLRDLDCVIIDEVSMISSEIIRQMNLVCCEARHCSKAFGGLQVIMAGDFYQLPPIEHAHVFHWDQFDLAIPHRIHLRQNHRQKEEQLAAAVREISRGVTSTKTCQLLESLSRPIDSNTQKPLHIYATNYDVDVCNSRHLKVFSGPESVFKAKDSSVTKRFTKLCPVSKNLKLKVGAPVMLCQTLSRFLCNGRMGHVNQIGCDSISVKFGMQVHEISRATFTFKGVIGKRVQFPLRLAFGLTVHRAQGLTLDCVVVHCDKMTTPGQLGVALGRAKSLAGLQVEGFSAKLQIQRHPAGVLQFYECTSHVCTCHDEEPTPYAFSQSSQETATASECSQEMDSDDNDDPTPTTSLDVLCPELPIASKYAKKMKVKRNRLKLRKRAVKKFVTAITERLTRLFHDACPQRRITNKRQTAFFAAFHAFTTSPDYQEAVRQLFGEEQPGEHSFAIAYIITSNLRDQVISTFLPAKEEIQAFLPSHSTEVSLCNVKYIAGFCVYGLKKRLKNEVLTSLRSKKSRIDPDRKDYGVKLLESLEDRSLESEYNDQIERKQQPGCRLFMPNKETTLYFSYLNDSVREYETVCNVESIGSVFYDEVKKKLLSKEETKARFAGLFKVQPKHEFLQNANGHEVLHGSVIEDLFEDILGIFLNMSARSFRKEYVRLRAVAREDAKRKQVKMVTKQRNESDATFAAPSTDHEVVIEQENADLEVCIVCSTQSEDGTICCDGCNVWCHCECVGVNLESINTIDKWFCPLCVGSCV